MQNERFFDQTLSLIEQGQSPLALPMLAGKLYNAHSDAINWDETRASFHRHPLRTVLLEDPYLAHCVAKPRGYAGDAALIDIIYDRKLPDNVSTQAAQIFAITTAFPTCDAVRLRREYAQKIVSTAWQKGKRICVLACGHFREGDALIGEDMSNLVAVDQDPLSLDVVRRNHGETMTCVEANVFNYLRGAVARGETFDLIYTLGLTDYLDDRAMRLLHKMMKSCLAPEGTILLANFRPFHLSAGWMDAVMEWQLIYRSEEELAGFAREIGMTHKTWADPTGCIAWCEMSG
jgi:extracellular factor (EF) 3-hydroxypalmitic acid methyl ester biosynthesis protein